MTNDHTTKTEDEILTICENFGGAAADAAEIVERLDGEITKCDKQIGELEAEIEELNNEEEAE